MDDPLARLVAPLSPEAFVRDHWDHSAVLGRGVLDRFAAIYDLEAWRSRRHMRDIDAATRDAQGSQRQLRIDAARIDELYSAGMTICADVSDEPRMASYLDALQRRLRLGDGQAFAKLYASKDGSGFAMHMDAHHVFVAQLEGRKRWLHSRVPEIESALTSGKVDPSGAAVLAFPRSGEPMKRDDGTPVVAPDPASLETVELEPGDCLYLPPGTWHATQALGHSLAVSISPPRQTPLSLFMRVLHREAERRPQWRRDIMSARDPEPGPGRISPSVEAATKACLADLRALVAELDPREVHRQWSLDVHCGRASAEATPVSSGRVRRAHRLTHRGLTFLVAPRADGEGDAIYIYRPGSEFSLPIEAHAFVKHLCAARDFRADEALTWDPDLDWDSAREVLEQLVEAGIVAHVPAS